MAEVASAFVSLLPSAKGFGRSLEKQVGGEVDTSGKKMGSRIGTALKVGIVAGVAGAGVAAAGFLKGALGEAREAQKVSALTASTIKTTGQAAGITAGQVGKLAGQLSAISGIDDETIQSGENLLLTFKNIRNEVDGKFTGTFNQATSAITDMSAALGQDMKASAIQLGKALNDPVKGISALSRVGVSFTETQKATVKSLIEGGSKNAVFAMGLVENNEEWSDALKANKGDIEATAKVLTNKLTPAQRKHYEYLKEGNHITEAQGLILKEIKGEFGGAAKAQATAGDKARVAWGNFQETVGTMILPLWDKILGGGTKVLIFLTNNIGPAFKAIGDFIKPLKASVADLFDSFSSSSTGAGLLSTFGTLGATLKASLLPALQTAATTFRNVILPALVSVGQYLAANWLPIIRTVAGIFVSQVLPALSSVAQFLYGRLYPAIVRTAAVIGAKLKPVLDALFVAFRNQVLPAVQQIVARFREWQPTIQRVTLAVVKVVGQVLIFAAAVLGKVLPVVIKFAAFLLSHLVPAILNVIEFVARLIGAAFRIGAALVKAGASVVTFVQKVNTGTAKVVGFIIGLPGKILDALGDFGSLLYNAGKELIGGLIDGIGDKIKDLKNKVGEVAGTIKGFFPGSPVKQGPLTSWNRGGAGKRLVGLLADGLGDTRAVEAAAGNLASRVNIPSPRIADLHTTAVGAGAHGGGGPTFVHQGDIVTRDPREWLRWNQDRAFRAGAMG